MSRDEGLLELDDVPPMSGGDTEFMEIVFSSDVLDDDRESKIDHVPSADVSGEDIEFFGKSFRLTCHATTECRTLTTLFLKTFQEKVYDSFRK